MYQCTVSWPSVTPANYTPMPRQDRYICSSMQGVMEVGEGLAYVHVHVFNKCIYTIKKSRTNSDRIHA